MAASNRTPLGTQYTINLCTHMAARMQVKQIQANGLDFVFLEAGPTDGQLALFLHGYPDGASTWEHQLPAFAAAGYRAVAPWLRGYPPTEIPPPDAYYDRATLAVDVAALIEALSPGEPCVLIGQDWGAAISYGVLAAFPQLVSRAVLLSVPHPAEVRATIKKSPRHALRSFHWFLFQLPWLPEWLCARRGYAFLETLWKLWSPDFHDQAHVAEIRRAMATPGALKASLAYYRAMFRKSKADPALSEVRARLEHPIRVPTRVLCGSRDMRKEMLEDQRRHFIADYDWTTVEGAGHFLHRERPDAVNILLLDWVGHQIHKAR
ncbi:MAG: alpha/beta hydrolase [Luteimonas sp.]